MKRIRLSAIFLISLSLLTTNAAIAQSGAPSIRSVSPDEAVAGDRITIRGRNFITDEDAISVVIGGAAARVVKAKRKKLIVEVPSILELGTHTITVSIGNQTSNAEQIEIVERIAPIQGLYLGQIAQGVSFNFRVLDNQRVVTQLRTSFDCFVGNCRAGANVVSDKFADIQNNRFEMEFASNNVTVKIKGVFTSETRAEGTAEFTISGICTCETGIQRWSARLE